MSGALAALMALTWMGCELTHGDIGSSRSPIVRKPGPQADGTFRRRTNADPQTHRRGRRGRDNCVERDYYHDGMVCFPMDPANGCNEADSVVVSTTDTHTLTTGLTLSLPGVGSVSSSEALTYSVSSSVTVEGEDCHYCWAQVCYTTRVQKEDCTGTGGTPAVRDEVSYSSPVIDGDMLCQREDSECGCDGGTPDAGVDAGSDAGSDAGRDSGTDAGADSGTDAGADSGTDAGGDAGRGGRDAS